MTSCKNHINESSCIQFFLSGYLSIYTTYLDRPFPQTTPSSYLPPEQISVEMGKGAPHVAILPSLGMGHLIPLSEFAKVLASRHGFTVTFLTLDDSPRVRSFIDALPQAITCVPLPSPSLHDLPPESKAETLISVTMARCLPSLRQVMMELKATTNLVSLVVDLFGTDAFDVAKELGVRPYIMFPSTATVLSFMFHLPELDQAIQGEYRDHPQLIRVPGCVPVHGRDLMTVVQDRKDQAYSLILRHATRYEEADGVFVNSSSALEPGPIRELMRSMSGPPVYPIGPLIQLGGAKDEDDNSGCVKWLEKQPHGSVLFVCFGSGGTLSSEQLTELATGLEMSGQRFLWAIRSPMDTKEGAFFGVKSKDDPLLFLPDGFLERTKGVGMVVDSWAPQLAVLKHASTGGFLTHCGWNSTLESIVHRVPMITWPLYAEQKMNAVLLTEEMKVAISSEVDERRGLVGREEVSRVVRALMDGEDGKKVRDRMKSVEENALRELEVGGSSYSALEQVVNKWKNTTN